MSRRNFITRACACILASSLLACTVPVHAQDLTNAAATYPSIPQMTLEEYPVVDGSLACIPLMESLIQAVTGCDQATAEESLANFTNTNPSYRALTGRSDPFLRSLERNQREARKSKRHRPLPGRKRRPCLYRELQKSREQFNERADPRYLHRKDPKLERSGRQ